MASCVLEGNVLRDRYLQGLPALLEIGTSEKSGSIHLKAIDTFSVRILLATIAVLLGQVAVVVAVLFGIVTKNRCFSAFTVIVTCLQASRALNYSRGGHSGFGVFCILPLLSGGLLS